MSEFQPMKNSPEEQVIMPEVHEKASEPSKEKLIEAHNRDIKGESLEAARTAVHETTEELSSVKDALKTNEDKPDSLPDASSVINKDLRNITKNREIKNIQRKLPKSQRTLSRIIHQPVVRVISDAAANTVSRPSGLMGGGIVALIGTTSYYLLAKHIGFAYNYTVFFALFVGGFVVGLVLELLVHVFMTSRRHHTD